MTQVKRGMCGDIEYSVIEYHSGYEMCLFVREFLRGADIDHIRDLLTILDRWGFSTAIDTCTVWEHEMKDIDRIIKEIKKLEGDYND